MSRTVSAATTTAVAQPVTVPGFLVEIGFSTPLRLSTRGTVTWSGSTWTRWNLQLLGLGVDASGSSSGGSLIISNPDYSVSALVLSENIANRAVNVWKFYGEAPATADPVHIFSGIADNAQIDPTRGMVTISLVQANASALFAPRFYITPESGFSRLPASGTVIDWDGERYQLEAEE